MLFRSLRRMMAARNASIFRDYMERRVRLYPFWSKKPTGRNLVSADEETSDSTPVPPIDLGPATVWECSSSDEHCEQKLVLVAPRNKLKVFKDGIGIGPPTNF